MKMNIKTPRLIIDELKQTDKLNYFNNISHDKEVLKTFVCQYQEAVSDFDFDKYLGRDDLFAIRLKDTKELIGVFVECEASEENSEVEFGYGIGSSYWNQGYMTETVKSLIKYYFENKPYKTIYASFFPENIASKRVMEKCGMKYSHTKEKELVYQDKERDLIYYKIEKA